MSALLGDFSRSPTPASLSNASSSTLALDFLHFSVVYVNLCTRACLEDAVVLVKTGTLGHFDGALADNPCPDLALFGQLSIFPYKSSSGAAG